MRFVYPLTGKEEMLKYRQPQNGCECAVSKGERVITGTRDGEPFFLRASYIHLIPLETTITRMVQADSFTKLIECMPGTLLRSRAIIRLLERNRG